MQQEVEQLHAKNRVYDEKFEQLNGNYQYLLKLVSALSEGGSRPAAGTAHKLDVSVEASTVSEPPPLVAVVVPAVAATVDVKPAAGNSWLSVVKRGSNNDLQALATVTEGIAVANVDESVTVNNSASTSNSNSFYLTEEDRKTNFPPIDGTKADWFQAEDNAAGGPAESQSVVSTTTTKASESSAFLFSRSSSENLSAVPSTTDLTSLVDRPSDSAQVVADREAADRVGIGELPAVRKVVLPRQSREKTPLDVAVEQIVDVLQPRESQLEYRASVTGLIRKQNRLALTSCATFEIGLHTLSCQLPDDPQVLSIIFSKGHAPNWHKTVLSRLAMAVERNGSGFYSNSEGDDYRPAANHMLSNIHFSDNSLAGAQGFNKQAVASMDLSHKVHCVVDSVEVDVLPNARTDLCLLAFLEEVAQLVGQDNLFKRSLLLIRAWWVYETASYVGSAIKHYISDNAMVLMVAALFNLHHAEVTSPIIALSTFLRIYSKYDGFSEVITLQGIVPYLQSKQQAAGVAGGPISQITLISPDDEKHLISAALIDKYYRLVNAVNATEATPHQSVKRRSLSPEEEAAAGGGAEVVPAPVEVAIKPLLVIPPPSRSISISVERSGYNVLNPFTHANLLSEKMTTRRVVLMHKAFQIGTVNLAVILNAAAVATTAGTTLSGAADARNFFPACTARFKDQWRPDAVGNVIDPNDSSFSDFTEIARAEASATLREKLWQQVQYCNFVLEAVVTEAVIVSVTKEALALRGALPVGEIGKVLTDLSSMTHLSNRLKELYGGLKKLLERYEDEFLVANNHQFNPHVILRSTLTPEQEALIHSGSFPPEIFVRVGAKKITEFVPQSLNNMYMPVGGVPPNNTSGVGVRSPSPLGLQQIQQLQQQAGGGAGSNYLNYNVNTSLDRRMRQQLNGAPPPGMVPNSAANRVLPKQQQVQQQMMQQQNVMGGMNQQGGMQQYPNRNNKQQMPPQMLMQQKLQQQRQMQHQQMQQQQQTSELDWNEFDASGQQQNAFQMQQRGRGGMPQNQQQQMQHKRTGSANMLINGQYGQGGGNMSMQQSQQSQFNAFKRTPSVPPSGSGLLNNSFLLGGRGSSQSGLGGNFFLGDELDDDLLFTDGGGVQQQQNQNNNQNQFFETYDDYSGQSNQLGGNGGGGVDEDIDYLSPALLGAVNVTGGGAGGVGGGDLLLSSSGGGGGGLWGESSLLFTPSPPSSSGWLSNNK
eukprot:gene23112-29305_t